MADALDQPDTAEDSETDERRDKVDCSVESTRHEHEQFCLFVTPTTAIMVTHLRYTNQNWMQVVLFFT